MGQQQTLYHWCRCVSKRFPKAFVLAAFSLAVALARRCALVSVRRVEDITEAFWGIWTWIDCGRRRPSLREKIFPSHGGWEKGEPKIRTRTKSESAKDSGHYALLGEHVTTNTSSQFRPTPARQINHLDRKDSLPASSPEAGLSPVDTSPGVRPRTLSYPRSFLPAMPRAVMAMPSNVRLKAASGTEGGGGKG